MNELLIQVRSKFFQSLENESSNNKPFNDKELEMIKTKDNFVIRVIKVTQKAINDKTIKGDLVDLTVDRLRSILTWREENKIYEITAKDIPRELFEFGHFKLGRDPNTGQQVHLIRSIYSRSCPAFSNLQLKFSYFLYDNYILDAVDMIGIGDSSHVGLDQLDLNSLTKASKIESNWPSIYSRVYLTGMPKIAIPFLNILLRFMPSNVSDMLVFTNDIPNWIVDEVNEGRPIAPPECPNLEDLLRSKGESEKSIKKCLEHLEKMQRLCK